MKRFLNWLLYPHRLARAYRQCKRTHDAMAEELYRARIEAAGLALEVEIFEKARIKDGERIQVLLHQVEYLRAQLMQVRVSQATEGRAGWEVCCYIPEEVLHYTRNHPYKENAAQSLLDNILCALMETAIKGINRVDSQGKVCALVFEPLNINAPARAPRYVQALFDKDGKYKMSEKAWDQRTEEQRVRNAAGCS
jgi:hypothetical protein